MLHTTMDFLSARKKTIAFFSLFTLLLSGLLIALGVYVFLFNDLNNRTARAKHALSTQMDDIFIELKQITHNSALSCDKEDVDRLRKSSFYSPFFKELGLFNGDYKVYCSSLGPINISLYKSVVSRIQDSQERSTVSLMDSKTLGESTFFAFYQGENGIGVNGLAPPQNISSILDSIFPSDYGYELTLGKRLLSSKQDSSDSSVLFEDAMSLDNWSMGLVSYVSYNAYWERFWLFMPLLIVCWILLFVLCSVIYALRIYYRESLRHCVKRAIRQSEIDVHFQPIVPINGKSHYSMEALIRWHSPYHGNVSPPFIVEMSDKLGLIDELTWMVIRKVGDFYREYHAQLSEISISVNVDRHSLLKQEFAGTLAHILTEYPELKDRLVLEVTETSVLNEIDLPIMVSRFEHIKTLGVSLSVDDFGTGYAGLDFLRRFPYDTLKLDKVFINSLQDDQFTRQILTSMTKLAKELNMELVAEGVEREDQLEAVRALGVDRVQGYYFCRPLPKQDIIAWLEQNTIR